MPKFKIKATRTHWYEVEVTAEDELDAYAELDDWMAEDFEDFETNAQWEFEVIEKDGENNEQ